MRLTLALQALFLTLSFAAPVDPVASATASAPAAQSTACGDIVNSCNATFTAKQAHDCLISVPFNPAVATRFIKYYNDTLQFQTTLSYLKNPPSGYQQPAIDVIGGLEQIQRDIDQGAFPNQYAFEATLQNLAYSAHDAHLQLDWGILAAFTFASPYSIVSLSEDGIKVPKVYVTEDIWLSQVDSSLTPSAIKTINGQDVTDFLSQFAAANSIGNLEPHADWNDLMSSYAANIQDDYSIFESYIEFYPGETITLAFENDTQRDPKPWLAIYNRPGPTGPLATGGDFYNFFVLGFHPALFDPNAPDPCAATTTSDNSTAATNTSSSNAATTATSWPDSAYPTTADIYQPNLYSYGGGFLTGYFLKNISTAVLSIPTFQMYGNDTKTFADTVRDFLNTSHAAGFKHVLIDLQQNFGGDTLLAVDTFKHFFPSNDTFRGSRLRAHPTADVLGNTFTTYFATNRSPNSSVYDAVAASGWVATDRLNAATNQNFTSWGEFFGPHQYNGDLFTTVQRDNISSAIFDENALGIDIYGAAEPAALPQLYDPENIIILTDGLCSSACAVFVEMMHHDAGIRTVVVGGLPQNGPMQAASGSRGAQVYSSENIDDDILVAKYFNATTQDYLPDREDVFLTFIGINIRDQIREDQNVPLQFLYEAADCRIFYTADTWSHYTSLWTYAANAIWSNPKLCVAGSTGYASKSTGASVPPPKSSSAEYNASALLGTTNQFTNEFTGLQLDFSYLETVKGQSRTISHACNNHGHGCSIGRCNHDSKEAPTTQCFFRERMITCWSGTCHSGITHSGGMFNLISRLDEPAEIHGGGNRNEKGGVGYAIARGMGIDG